LTGEGKGKGFVEYIQVEEERKKEKVAGGLVPIYVGGCVG
jgi:hypothetical protein